MISLEKALKFIEESNGKVFSIEFVKRTTGELRIMTCRTGVKKFLIEKPSKPGVDFKKNRCICVCDMVLVNNGSKNPYGSIPIDGITRIMINKKWQKISKKLVNHIFLVLDSSASMDQMSTIKAFNALTEVYKNPPKDQENKISLLTFASQVNPPLYFEEAPKKLKPLTVDTYFPNGNTALFDAIGCAIKRFEQLDVDADHSFLIKVFTDGENNQIIDFTTSALRNLMNSKDDSWTFVFNMPPGHKDYFCSNFNFPPGNVKEWTDIQRMSDETQIGTTDYYATRSSGLRGTKNFYTNVPTDVSKNLDDLSREFKELTVKKEEIIKPFIERTGREYTPGIAYYQLMKPEKVQPSKEVLVKNKNTKQIYGGQEARSLIGIPNNQYVKVNPGDHGNYDVFIQSKSVNRVLPRGTKVLVKQ